MPHRIVDKYRPVYRQEFVVDTLYNIGGAKAYKAFGENGLGFKDCYIVVNFDGPKHEGLYAHNFVREYPSGKKEGIIQLNPIVREKEKYRQKEILAEEWIEVMMKFEGILGGEHQVLGNFEMAMLFNNLKRRTFWQDSRDFLIKMHAALRRLLVSSHSIEEMLIEDFGSSIQKLKGLVATDSNGARVLIEKFLLSFAGRWDVEKGLVFDRLQETLFKPITVIT